MRQADVYRERETGKSFVIVLCNDVVQALDGFEIVVYRSFRADSNRYLVMSKDIFLDRFEFIRNLCEE